MGRRPLALLAAAVLLGFWWSPVLGVLSVPMGVTAIWIYRRSQAHRFNPRRFWGMLWAISVFWIGIPVAVGLIAGDSISSGGAAAGAVTFFAITLPLALLIGGLVAGVCATSGRGRRGPG